MGNADFGLFVADLEQDQMMFRGAGNKAAKLLDAFDHRLREAADAFAHSRFPVFYTANLTVTSDLPSQMARWVTTAMTGKIGVLKILWVNVSAASGVHIPLRLGCVSDELIWAADRASDELHSATAMSVAIIIQDNLHDDELRSRSDMVAGVFVRATPRLDGQ